MKQRLLSFLIVLCALIPALPRSFAANAAPDAQIQITDTQFAGDTCSFQAAFSGAEIEGAVFALVYAQSGQMTQVERRDANETIPFSLSGLKDTDVIRVIWTDASNMPLAKADVFRNEVADNDETFASALFSMIQNYKPDESFSSSDDVPGDNAAQSGEDFREYALARLLVKSAEELPSLNDFQVAHMMSDHEGHTIIQFREATEAKRCADYLKERITDGYVEPDKPLRLPPEDSDAEVESAMSVPTPLSKSVSQIHADAYAAYLKAKGINRDMIVAVVDTGVDYNHEFLKSRVVSGYDYVGNDADPMDEQYHGTHVAGTIADCTPDLTNLKIMPVRVLDETGLGYSSVVAEGIRYAAKNGANVINLSLGGGHSDYKDEAIADAIAQNVTVVVAAGNTDTDAQYHCPAHVQGAITVAAVDSNFQPATFSNYGAIVDLAAPGVDINSSVPKRKSETGYAFLSGTSMAAPHVSACAAMLLEEFSGLSPAEVERKLTDATQTPPGWNQSAKKYGSGVADASSFAGDQKADGFYAILYDDGELTFQNSATPEPGRTTVEDPYFVKAVSGDSSEYALWHTYSNQIQTVTFAEKIQPLTTATWFSGCENLKTIRNPENLDMSKVKDMSQMFAGCKALTELDLNALRTDDVTNMRQMFFECSALELLDISEWNTANVTDMEDMFSGCGALKRIYASKSFDVSKVTSGAHMFQDCASLEGGLGTAYSSEHMDQSYARRDLLSGAGYFSSSRFYALLYKDGEFAFQDVKTPDPQKELSEFYRIGCVSEPVTQTTEWYDEREQIKRVTFADEIQPITTATWFLNCAYLTTVSNVENLNALRVKDMSQMFAGCAALTELNLSELNTNNAVNMRQMFFGCAALQTLDLFAWNTSNVTSMEDMFNGCKALKTIQAGNKFLVVNVTDGEYMFEGCESLIGGNGTKYDPAHVDKSYAQRDAAPLTPGYFSPGVDVPLPSVSETLYAVLYSDGELAFQSGTDAQSGKTALKTYETDSGGYAKGNARGSYMAWYDDRDSVTSVNFTVPIYPASTAQWFYSCENLRSVENPGNLHTDYVTDMSQMFAYCKSLTALDLSALRTDKTVDMSQMFYRCENLSEIYASSSFVVGTATKSDYMFYGCSAITGGKGTTYDRDHADGSYARIDDAPSAPGYFR